MNVDAMRINKQTQREPAKPGFAIQILPDTDLGGFKTFYSVLKKASEEVTTDEMHQIPLPVCGQHRGVSLSSNQKFCVVSRRSKRPV
jgi:hypothetical protein